MNETMLAAQPNEIEMINESRRIMKQLDIDGLRKVNRFMRFICELQEGGEAYE